MVDTQGQRPTDADRERFATALFEASLAGQIDDEEYARRLTRLGMAQTVGAMAAVVAGTDLAEPDAAGTPQAVGGPGASAPGASALAGGLPAAPAGRDLDPVDLALLMRKATPTTGKGKGRSAASIGDNRYKALIMVGALFLMLMVLGVLLAVFVHSGSSTTPATLGLWRALVGLRY